MSEAQLIDMRQVAHPRDVRRYDTASLRADFLIENLFRPGEISLTFSHIERMIVGGVMPLGHAVPLPAYAPTGTPYFLARREIGIFNIGGPGHVIVGGEQHALERLDALYVGCGHEHVSFASDDTSNPARFYLLSTPATRPCPVRRISQSDARKIALGAAEGANQRTICQYLVPDLCDTNQLVMGITMLAPGSVWNTMPAHTHDRRSEAYLYFDLGPDARVFHMMGEPTETRHLVVANQQAILAPNWSIHSGCGTSNYSFIWGMGGDNVVFSDMDPVAMADLR
ncbi:MAG: 5-dehydro-4-deoxy-D-glucuronate isomerase [Bosea sp. (in: a-proteobacteria)]